MAEVAEMLGVPPGTVKSRAHRARRLLSALRGGLVVITVRGARESADG